MQTTTVAVSVLKAFSLQSSAIEVAFCIPKFSCVCGGTNVIVTLLNVHISSIFRFYLVWISRHFCCHMF